MKKIPTLFQRDPDNMRRVLSEVHPDCQWVLDGEGIATRKYDGTCCLVRDGALYKRREIKPDKQTPDGFEQEGEPDPNTGKIVGWVPVLFDSPGDKYHVAAMINHGQIPKDGTYELCGPKVQGNPEGYEGLCLIAHEDANRIDAPRDYEGLREFLADFPHEGIVWHHPDGRMAKLKVRDFQ